MKYNIQIASTEDNAVSNNTTLVTFTPPTENVLHKFAHIVTIRGLSNKADADRNTRTQQSITLLLKLVRAGGITFLYEGDGSPPDFLGELRLKLIEILESEDQNCAGPSLCSPPCYGDFSGN